MARQHSNIGFENWEMEDFDFYSKFYHALIQVAKGVCDLDIEKIMEPGKHLMADSITSRMNHQEKLEDVPDIGIRTINDPLSEIKDMP